MISLGSNLRVRVAMQTVLPGLGSFLGALRVLGRTTLSLAVSQFHADSTRERHLSADPPSLSLPFAGSMKIRIVGWPSFLCSSGVQVWEISSTGAEAVTISDNEELISFFRPSRYDHFIDIDIESFPTGYPS